MDDSLAFDDVKTRTEGRGEFMVWSRVVEAVSARVSVDGKLSDDQPLAWIVAASCIGSRSLQYL